MKIEEPCGTRTRLLLYRKNNLVRKSVIYYLMVNKRPSKYIVFQIKRSSRIELYNNRMCFWYTCCFSSDCYGFIRLWTWFWEYKCSESTCM